MQQKTFLSPHSELGKAPDLVCMVTEIGLLMLVEDRTFVLGQWYSRNTNICSRHMLYDDSHRSFCILSRVQERHANGPVELNVESV